MPPTLSYLELNALSLLCQEPLYGQLIWIRLFQHIGASRSSTYEALRRLKRLGFIQCKHEASTVGPSRLRWQVTTKGRRYVNTGWEAYRLRLSERLRYLVSDYQLLLKQMNRPSLAREEAVPYTVDRLNTGTEVVGNPPTNPPNMGVDGITFGVIGETPPVLPELNSSKDSPGLASQDLQE